MMMIPQRLYQTQLRSYFKEGNSIDAIHNEWASSDNDDDHGFILANDTSTITY